MTFILLMGTIVGLAGAIVYGIGQVSKNSVINLVRAIIYDEDQIPYLKSKPNGGIFIKKRLCSQIKVEVDTKFIRCFIKDKNLGINVLEFLFDKEEEKIIHYDVDKSIEKELTQFDIKLLIETIVKKDWDKRMEYERETLPPIIKISRKEETKPDTNYLYEITLESEKLKELVLHIESVHEFILGKTELLTFEEKHEVKKLIHEKMKELITTYLSLSKEKRVEFQSEMEDGLLSILNQLKVISERIESKTLHDFKKSLEVLKIREQRRG